MDNSKSQTGAVLASYGLAGARVEPLGNGLINRTWRVGAPAGERYVLQCVNDMFPVAVNADIDALTRHLAASGLRTCRLVPTQDGKLCVRFDGRTWRLLTHIDGISHDSLPTVGHARSAGGLLARFHRSVDSLTHTFATERPGIHDTPRHLRFLRETLARRADHPQYAKIAALGNEILAAADLVPVWPPTPDRIVHGDPKINNILFARDSDEALCLIDLDTITHMPLPLELGDAMRSWCNPASENSRYGEFAAALFESAIGGYAEVARGWITPAESSAIVAATHSILIELGARFCADALNETYFGWNPARFTSRSEHNQVRAAGQLTVARSLLAQREQLDAMIAAAFAC